MFLNNRRSIFGIIAVGVALWALPLRAATTIWTNGGADSSWINPLNWSNGIPDAAFDVQIGVLPTDDLIGLDTGSATNVIQSLAIGVSVVDPIDFVPAGPETLTILGDITNNASSASSFEMSVIAGGNGTYAGGSGGLIFGALDVNTRTIATSGILSTLSLSFSIFSSSLFGSIGAIDASGALISISGAYTGSFGDTFDLTSGNFAGATLTQLPTLDVGLSWNTSLFQSQGILSVVPESGSCWLVCGALSLWLATRGGFRAAGFRGGRKQN